MDKLFIVIPAYNEEQNIESVIRQWYPYVDSHDKGEGHSTESRLVIADSGSSDNTHNIILKLKKTFPQIEIISNTLRYHGPKVIALYKYAIANGADYIFQTDGDGQTNPAEFKLFWLDRANYVGIFGYRKVRGDGKDRALVEKAVCFLVHLFFGVKVPDANAPFRLMNARALSKYMDKFRDDYNLPNIIITAFFAKFESNIVFREISFKSRSAGTSSVNIPRIMKIGMKALYDFYVFRKAIL